MIRVCAWCQQVLGGIAAAETPITHGICDPCAERWLADSFQEPLERLSGPVMMLDGSGRILDANRRVSDVFNRPVLSGEFFGDAAACPNASLPGGCGQTPDCTRCESRAVFERTARTGLAQHTVRAGIAGDARKVMTLTAERVGTAVLLRIDDVENVSE